MFFELDISTIVQTVYTTPVSYLIFYYLILFSIISIVKKIINININALNTELGIFKIDKNSVPTLLFIGWFGFLFKAVTEISGYAKPTALLSSALIFIVLLFTIKKIQTKIQGLIVTFFHNPNVTRVSEDRRTYYVREMFSSYSFITISVFLIMFCLNFSLIKLGNSSFYACLLLMILYAYFIIVPKIKDIKENLKHW